MRVTRNYQVTIPAEVRRELGVRVGDVLIVRAEGDRIVMRKADVGLPRIRLGGGLTTEQIERLIEESAAEVSG